jgi:hypothetical protein
MSARWLFVRSLAAGLLAAVWMTHAAWAKPPDLPIDTKEDCATESAPVSFETLSPIAGPVELTYANLKSAVFNHTADLCSRGPGLILGVRQHGNYLTYGLHPIATVLGADLQAGCDQTPAAKGGSANATAEFLKSSEFRYHWFWSDWTRSYMLAVRKCGRRFFFGLHPIAAMEAAADSLQSNYKRPFLLPGVKVTGVALQEFSAVRVFEGVTPDGEFTPDLEIPITPSQPASETGTIEVIPVMPVEEEQLTVMPTKVGGVEKLTVMPAEVDPDQEYREIERLVESTTFSLHGSEAAAASAPAVEQLEVMPTEIEELPMPAEVKPGDEPPPAVQHVMLNVTLADVPTRSHGLRLKVMTAAEAKEFIPANTHILSRPQLVTLSGQTACFQISGERPFSLPEGVMNMGPAGDPFEFSLKVQPTVLEGGQMVLGVETDYSQRSLDQGSHTTFEASPLITQRIHASAELCHGQTMAIRGFHSNARELLILVTPQLVHVHSDGQAVQPKSEAPSPSVCPYLREQAAKKTNLDQSAILPCDPIKHLEKLLDARHAYRMGEFYRNAGLPNTARAYYEMVHQHCPGSHIDKLAVKHLGEIDQELAPLMFGEPAALPPPGRDEDQGEEQEQIPPPKEELEKTYSGPQSASDRRKKQLAELVSRFKLRYEEGKYDEAEVIATEIHDLSEPVGDALLYVIQMGRNVAERRIERALAQPITLNCVDTPLRNALKDLGEANGIRIVLDQVAIDEEMLNLDCPVTKKLDNISLRSALNIILDDAHLTWVIREGAIRVTTKPHGHHNHLVERVYAVADLVDDDEDGPNHEQLAKLWPKKNESMHAQLVALIKSAIPPRSWSDKDGAETVEYFPRSKTLLVRETPDIQEQVADLLEALRRLKKGESAGEESQSEGLTREPHVMDYPPLPPVDPQTPDALQAILVEQHDTGSVSTDESPLWKVLDGRSKTPGANITKRDGTISLTTAMDIVLQDTAPSWVIDEDVTQVTMDGPGEENPRSSEYVIGTASTHPQYGRSQELIVVGAHADQEYVEDFMVALRLLVVGAGGTVEPPGMEIRAFKAVPVETEDTISMMDALDAVRSSACAGASSTPEGLWAWGQLCLTGTFLRVACDNDGKRCIVVFMSDGNDLREAQWAHNDEMIRWIEAVGGNQ